jgi:hypothetical protein
VTDEHAVETVEGPQVAETPEWAAAVEAEATEEHFDAETGVCLAVATTAISARAPRTNATPLLKNWSAT